MRHLERIGEPIGLTNKTRDNIAALKCNFANPERRRNAGDETAEIGGAEVPDFAFNARPYKPRAVR